MRGGVGWSGFRTHKHLYSCTCSGRFLPSVCCHEHLLYSNLNLERKVPKAKILSLSDFYEWRLKKSASLKEDHLITDNLLAGTKERCGQWDKQEAKHLYDSSHVRHFSGSYRFV